ncbi:MAG: glycogen-branching enzyme, partial [Oscillospiraceae bacterium]
MNFGEFYSGNCFDAYRWLGAHPDERGTVFRVYAPAADAVSVIGEFNGWTDSHMERTIDEKFWELYIDGARAGQMYKYR